MDTDEQYTISCRYRGSELTALKFQPEVRLHPNRHSRAYVASRLRRAWLRVCECCSSLVGIWDIGYGILTHCCTSDDVEQLVYFVRIACTCQAPAGRDNGIYGNAKVPHTLLGRHDVNAAKDGQLQVSACVDGVGRTCQGAWSAYTPFMLVMLRHSPRYLHAQYTDVLCPFNGVPDATKAVMLVNKAPDSRAPDLRPHTAYVTRRYVLIAKNTSERY